MVGAVAHAGSQFGEGLVPAKLRGLDSTSVQSHAPQICALGCSKAMELGGSKSRHTHVHLSLPSSQEGTGLMETLSLAQQRPSGCKNQWQLVFSISALTVH